MVEDFLGDREADDDGSPFCSPGQEFSFRRERRAGIFLQNRKGLEVAVEIDGRGGLVFVVMAIGGRELRFEGMDPEWLVGGITQSECDGDEEQILAGHFGGGNKIDRTGTLGPGTLVKSDDGDDDSDGDKADQNDAGGWKVALGGAEFISDIEVGKRGGRRSGSGQGGRRRCGVGRRGRTGWRGPGWVGF